MSRVSTGDVIVQKPSNNIYTVLAAVGFIVGLIGLILFFVKAGQVLGADWWKPS